MKHIAGNSNEQTGVLIASWFQSQKQKIIHAPYYAIGFLNDDGHIVGACILDQYNGSNIYMHIYGPRAWTRPNIKICLEYIFNSLKCTRLTVVVPRSNRKMLKYLERCKMKFEAILESYYGVGRDKDGVVYKMTPSMANNWIKING